jgi:outer membrane usher protein
MTARMRCSRAAAAVLLIAAAAVPAVAADFALSHQFLSKTVSTLDAEVRMPAGELATTAIASLRNPQAPLVRLESAWKVDLGGERFLRLGDTISNPGAWGSAVRYGGLQLGTPHALRDDLVHAPRLALSGLAVLPSSADLLFGSLRLPHTALSRRGLTLQRQPLVGGSGVSVLARDASGRSATVGSRLLATPRGAAPGCRAFTLGLGRAREDYGMEGDRYGALFANTTVACGLPAGFAVEAHGEYLAGEAGLAGLHLSRRLGGVGAASVAVAASDALAGNGWAVQMGLAHEHERFDFALQARLQSEAYRELGAADPDSTDAAIAQRMLASIARRFGSRGTLALAYAMQRTHDADRADIVGLSQSYAFSRRSRLSFAANQAIDDDRRSSVNLSWSREMAFR